MLSEGTVRFVNAVSRLFGWIYFLSWSISFYPQPLLNYRRKSTAGVLLDFPFLNVIGFIFYSLSNALLFWSSEIRGQYAARNPVSPEPTVRFNDVAFGFHALILTSITLTMFYKSIWGFAQDRQRKLTSMTVVIAWSCFIGIGIVIALVLTQGTIDPLGWSWIDLVRVGFAQWSMKTNGL